MGLLNKIFFKIGYLSASNPFTACFFAAMVTLICSLGFINYKLTVSYTILQSHNYNIRYFRTIPKIYGFRQHQEQMLSRHISMNNSAHSLESIHFSLHLKMKRMQTMIYSKNHISN